MCAPTRAVSVVSGAMTLAATMPLIAISVLAWVMIGLPIVLLTIVAVMYVVRGGRTTEEVERSRRAAESDAAEPAGPEGRSPGA
jgi:flagellar basal body-associated protein FliL